MAYASAVDLDEAYRVGKKAVELAAGGQRGFMATILRDPGPIYSVRYERVPLAEVANSERSFPKHWIAPSGCDVTDDFVRYAKPLVGSEMITLPTIDGPAAHDPFRSRFTPSRSCPKYVPQADRAT